MIKTLNKPCIPYPLQQYSMNLKQTLPQNGKAKSFTRCFFKMSTMMQRLLFSKKKRLLHSCICSRYPDERGWGFEWWMWWCRPGRAYFWHPFPWSTTGSSLSWRLLWPSRIQGQRSVFGGFVQMHTLGSTLQTNSLAFGTHKMVLTTEVQINRCLACIGVLILLSERTLFDYPHWVKGDVSFHTAVNMWISKRQRWEGQIRGSQLRWDENLRTLSAWQVLLFVTWFYLFRWSV